MSFRWAGFGLFGVCLGLISLGCGSGLPSTVPVKGSLTWEDGKPISGVSIRLVPAAQGGREATGFSGKDGEFTLSTFSNEDGAVPGDYTVVLAKQADVTVNVPTASTSDPTKAMAEYYKKSKTAAPPPRDPIPAAYHDAKSSPLKQRIESGGNPDVKFKVRKG